MSRRERLRFLAFRIAALCLAGLAFLLIAELVLRLAGLAPTTGVYTVTESEFERVPGLFSPNQNVSDTRNPNLPHRATTGTLGYRGPDFPLAKPPGQARILVVGDSFAYGDFVDDGESLPAQLQALLAERGSPALVINAGVGGTTIVTHHNMAERALPLEPDLVVLVFSENDVHDLARTPMWDRFADNRRRKSRFPLSLAYPVLRRSAVWNFALNVQERFRVGFAEPDAGAGQPAAQAEPDLEAERARYSEALGVMQRMLADQGVPLVFVAYPSRRSLVEGPLWSPWAVGVARDHGIPSLDLTPALEESGHDVESLYLLPYDAHPSPRGYAVSAGALAEALEEWGLFPKSH